MNFVGKISIRSLSELVGEKSTVDNEAPEMKEEIPETTELPETPQKIKKKRKAATTSRKRTHTVESNSAVKPTVTTTKKSRTNHKGPLPGQLKIDKFFNSAAKTYKIESKKEETFDTVSEMITTLKKGLQRQRTSKTSKRHRKALFKDDGESSRTAPDEKKLIMSSRKTDLKAEMFIDLCDSDNEEETEQVRPNEGNKSEQPNPVEVISPREAVVLNSAGFITPAQSSESKTSLCPGETSISPELKVINYKEFPSPDPKSGESNNGARAQKRPSTRASTMTSVPNGVECADKCPPDRELLCKRFRSQKRLEETPKTSNQGVKTKAKQKTNVKDKVGGMSSSSQEKENLKQPSEDGKGTQMLDEVNESTKPRREVQKKGDSVIEENGIQERNLQSHSATKCSPALSSKKHIPGEQSLKATEMNLDKSSHGSGSLHSDHGHLDLECSPTKEIIVLSDGEEEIYTNLEPLSTKKAGKQNTNKNTTVKKPRRPCPPYKVVEGTTFGVDSFNYGDIEGVTHYFLTHFHADHYIGLNRKFSHHVYMSSITARLLRIFKPIDEQYIHELSLNEPVVIEDVEVTAIDANHCPGAIMLIFKTKEGRCTLHTGDFRASAEMESEPVFWNNDIHTIYLDTTYFPRKYAFCPQSESIDRAFRILEEFNEKNIGTRILYVCGSYLVGKEKFWSAIAWKFKLKVWAESNRRKVLEAIGDEDIMPLLVEDPLEAQLHVISMVHLGYWALEEYIDKYSSHYDILLAFRPSGWEKNSKPQFRGKVNIVGIEYSEHSSHDELKRFVQYLKPKKVISTVPVGKDLMKTARIPDGWYRYDKLTGLQREYQPSITNYFKLNSNENDPKAGSSTNKEPNKKPSDKEKVDEVHDTVGMVPTHQAKEDDDWLT